MTTIYDVDINELLDKAAEELKKIEGIKPPEWADFVKTGAHKERPPIKDDWWYSRCAAVLRSVYVLGPIGTSKLRTKYGGKKRRGVRPPIFAKGSGSILRKALQQLEKAGLVKQDERKGHKGRVVTPEGKSLLDKTASTMAPKQEVKKEKPKVAKLKKEAKEKVEAKPKVEPKEKAKVEIKNEVKVEKPKEEPKKEEVKEKKEEIKPEIKKEEKVEVKTEKPKKEQEVKKEEVKE